MQLKYSVDRPMSKDYFDLISPVMVDLKQHSFVPDHVVLAIGPLIPDMAMAKMDILDPMGSMKEFDEQSIVIGWIVSADVFPDFDEPLTPLLTEILFSYSFENL